jgi:hypothetical protein
MSPSALGFAEDPRVGDAEALEVVGDEGGRRRVEGQVDVDRVEAGAVEEVVALGRDHVLQVGARHGHGDQRQAVVRVDLGVEFGPSASSKSGGGWARVPRRSQRARVWPTIS